MFIRKDVYEELLNRIDRLEKRVEEAENKYSRAAHDVEYETHEQINGKFKIIDRHIRETIDNNDERIDKSIDDKFEELKSELDSKIEKAIKDANIEDKVLLKVVKATFNNWKEEE